MTDDHDRSDYDGDTDPILNFDATTEGERYHLSGMRLVIDCVVERVGDELMEVEFKDRRYNKWQLANLINNHDAHLRGPIKRRIV